MGPLGYQEILFILALALLIFGPRELPKIGRTIGRAMGEFRKASTELKRSLNAEMIEEELRQSDPRRRIRESAKELEATVKATIEADDSETAEPSATGRSPAAAEPDAAGAPADGSAPVPRDRTATAAGT